MTLSDPATSFAEFATSLSVEDIPADVVDRARLHILDAIGCALAASGRSEAGVLIGAVEGMGLEPGDHPVMGRSTRLGLREAVVANAALVHYLDFDDTHTASVTHVSAPIVPLVIALAQRLHSSGEEMLAAYIAGVEIMARVGLVSPGGFHAAGFHATAVCAPFGAAVAACRLLGADSESARTAQGLALSFTGGTNEWLAEGAWNKRFHPGMAAVSGLQAAMLGTGRVRAVEFPYAGERGLYNQFAVGGPRDWSAADGLGQRWEMMGTSIKPFPSCHSNHAFAEMALMAVHERGVDPDRVNAVHAEISAPQLSIVAEPAELKRHPATTYEAQFSLHYTVAAAMVQGQFAMSQVPESLQLDPQITRIMQLVNVTPMTDSLFPTAYSGRMTVETYDGELLPLELPVNLGHERRPLDQKAIVDKFYANAELALEPERSKDIAEAVLHLEAFEDVANLNLG